MKHFWYILTLLIFFVSVPGAAQPWKEYADTASVFFKQEDFEKAITYYQKAKNSLPKDSAAGLTAVQYNNMLGSLYLTLGQYGVAEPILLQVRESRKKLQGENHPDYAKSCNNLGLLYYNTADYKKAGEYYLEAKQVRERIFGKQHREYATSCNNLATVYHQTGEYDKAEQLYLEASAIREQLLGPDHIDNARTYNNLGNFYGDAGDFTKAEIYYLKANRLMLQHLGEEDPDFAANVMNIGSFYQETGRYLLAEKYYLKACAILGKYAGGKNAYYAAGLDNLGDVYRALGQYEKAEHYFYRALSIKKESGIQDAEYATICQHLGMLYASMGQPQKSEEYYLQAKQTRELLFGPDHQVHAEIKTNLAILYYLQKKLGDAEQSFREVKEFIEKSAGKNHYYYINACINLGIICLDLKKFADAEHYFKEGALVAEGMIGTAHPFYSRIVVNLAALSHEQGKFEEAKNYYTTALDQLEKSIGTNHEDYVSTCNALGDLFWNFNDTENAGYWFKKGFYNNYEQVRKIFYFTSETEKELFIKNTSGLNHKYMSFYTHSASAKAGDAFSLSFMKRNLILNSVSQLKESVYQSADSGTIQLYDKLVDVKNQIAYWYAKPKAERPPVVARLEYSADSIEKKLVQASSMLRKQRNAGTISWQDIQQQLGSGEAAIEFAAFSYYDGRVWTDSTIYIALLLRKDRPGPELIRLFEKKQLDSLLSYKKTSPGPQKLALLYSHRIKETVPGLSKSLYELIWAPLAEKLKGIKTVYYAPDGALHKIAFSALPVNEKQVLSDYYKLVQLSTTASVGERLNKKITLADKLVLYGGVQYDVDSTRMKQAAALLKGNEIATRSLPQELLREGVGDFYYLTGAEKEISEIEKMALKKSYTVSTVNGINATEESFKNLSGKEGAVVLHIATHGFFFPDPQRERRDDRLGGAVVFRQSENPLMRSGLALAGANHAWKGKPVTGVEDGILTSYEISNMYLPGTRLAVLSACETGLGDIEDNEGVYGLQRAFKIAGVENLVMSLWRVDDRASAEFMQFFYAHLFDQKSIQDAFYHTQTLMKNKYRNDPYKWAAWVLIR